MQAQNKVVVRRRNGDRIKGYAFDFNATKDRFHVADAADRKKVVEVQASELKAVFYVKSFEGDRNRSKSSEQAEQAAKTLPGVKLKVTFEDGEVLYGTTNGYSKNRPGFFVIPSDPATNNVRAFVFAGATKSVESWR